MQVIEKVSQSLFCTKSAKRQCLLLLFTLMERQLHKIRIYGWMIFSLSLFSISSRVHFFEPQIPPTLSPIGPDNGVLHHFCRQCNVNYFHFTEKRPNDCSPDVLDYSWITCYILSASSGIRGIKTLIESEHCVSRRPQSERVPSFLDFLIKMTADVNCDLCAIALQRKLSQHCPMLYQI